MSVGVETKELSTHLALYVFSNTREDSPFLISRYLSKRSCLSLQ